MPCLISQNGSHENQNAFIPRLVWLLYANYNLSDVGPWYLISAVNVDITSVKTCGSSNLEPCVCNFSCSVDHNLEPFAWNLWK